MIPEYKNWGKYCLECLSFMGTVYYTRRIPYRVRMNLYSIDLHYIYRYFATHAMRE